jgi:hypothetical protein
MTPKQIKLAEAAARAFTRLADRATAAEESVNDAIEALKVLIADESDDTDPTTYREFGYAWETAQEVAGKVKGALNRAQAAVGDTLLLVRSNRATPSNSSSLRSWTESVGWLTPQASAARPKCPCSATASR